jgi:predicted transcriptional regulator
MEQKNAQDAIIQAINHSERREILRIIQRQPEGTKYSNILGESQLTTSKLNYQLNELQGLIEKNKEGLYSLTLLGQKAINILDSINQNLEGGIELAPMLENQRKKLVTKKLNGLFYFLIAGSVLSPLVLTYFYFTEAGGIPTWVLALTYVLSGAFMYWMNQMRKNSPRYFLSFIDWLDWKFFNGKGSDEFRGRKMLVLTVLGLVIGALAGKAGLGLIIGLFLGAAMEY